MYLIWFVIFTFILAFILKTLLDIKYENSLIIGQVGIIIVLYLFYIMDILEIGLNVVCTCFAIAIVLSIVISIKRKRIKDNLRAVCTYSAAGYILYLAAVYCSVKNKVPFWGDELRYWAAVPKILYKYHGALQLNNGFQIFSVDYIPGISIYQYFLETINGKWSDSLRFFAYAAVTGALLLPVGKSIKRWYNI